MAPDCSMVAKAARQRSVWYAVTSRGASTSADGGAGWPASG